MKPFSLITSAVSCLRLLAIIGISFCSIYMLWGCSSSSIADSGNSSQTGNNGMIISARDGKITGTTHPGAQICIYDQNYRPNQALPGLSDSTFADDSGHFSFSDPRSGYFNIIAWDEKQGTSAYMAHIPLFKDTMYIDTVDSLRLPGWLIGRAIDSLGQIFVYSDLYINGTPFYTVTNIEGVFKLGPLPSGQYTVNFIANYKLSEVGIAQIIEMFAPVKDTAITTILSGEDSEWHL